MKLYCVSGLAHILANEADAPYNMLSAFDLLKPYYF